MPVRAQDGPATPQNSSRTDLFIGFGGQSRLGNGDAGWRSAITLSVDVNVTDRVALVVMPALGVGVSTSAGELGGLRVPGRTAVPVRRAAARDALRTDPGRRAAWHCRAGERRGARITSRPWDGIPDVLRWWRRRNPEPAVRVARHPGRRAQPVRRPERWPPARGIVGSGDPVRHTQVAVSVHISRFVLHSMDEFLAVIRPDLFRERQSLRRPRGAPRGRRRSSPLTRYYRTVTTTRWPGSFAFVQRLAGPAAMGSISPLFLVWTTAAIPGISSLNV